MSRLTTRHYMLVLWAALAGCGAETVPAGQPAMAVAGSGSAPVDASGRCVTGTSSCYCPDGQLSGTQVCDARQQLGTCQCAVTAPSAEQGVMSAPTDVCPQLAGSMNCAAQSYVSPQLPSSVLFVIDRSGSMACNAPPIQSVESCNVDPQPVDPSQPSRWDITTNALDATFGSLVGSAAAVGLSMFSTDGFCGVDSTPIVGVDPVDATQLTALGDAMHKAQPAGGTPIVGAVISAYHHLHEELRATGNRYVVLITDGEESCGMLGVAEDKADLLAARNRLLETEVQKARMANIKTFVVGTPGSEGARGFLSELAFRGGTARNVACAHGDTTGTVGDCHY
ncbi:MAG: vWA domain-containing protein, partial [Polyangiales bacterium]